MSNGSIEKRVEHAANNRRSGLGTVLTKRGSKGFLVRMNLLYTSSTIRISISHLQYYCHMPAAPKGTGTCGDRLITAAGRSAKSQMAYEQVPSDTYIATRCILLRVGWTPEVWLPTILVQLVIYTTPKKFMHVFFFWVFWSLWYCRVSTVRVDTLSSSCGHNP